MQYFQPFDKPNVPEAPYVNADPANGVPGSIPDARGFEAAQREIVAVIRASGQTPSSTDNAQFLHALRGGVLDYTVDTGAANAIVITPVDPYIALVPGNTFKIKTAAAPTGDTVAQISLLTGLGVRRSGGQKLTGGEWAAGDIVTFVWDGSYLQLRGSVGGGGLLLSNSIVLNVPGQFPTIRAALRAAAGYLKLPDIYVDIKIAGGLAYTEVLTAATLGLYLSDPGGQRVRIIGPNLKGAGFPGYADIDGLTNAQVQSLLYSRFDAFIVCQGTWAIELHVGFLNLLSNIAVIGDASVNGPFTGIKVGSWSSEPGFGAMSLQNVWIHNFGLDGLRAEVLSLAQCINVGVTYCGFGRSSGSGAWSSRGSNIACNSGNLVLMYNNVNGTAFNNGLITVDSSGGTIDVRRAAQDALVAIQNGRINMLPATGVRITDNGTSGNGWGGNAFSDSSILLPASAQLARNPSGDLTASGNSRIYALGATLGTCSPAKNTQSSDGSRILN